MRFDDDAREHDQRASADDAVPADLSPAAGHAARPQPARGGFPDLGRFQQYADDLPDEEELLEWLDEGGGCQALDGCWVEPDGQCPHGLPSWLRALRMI
jgi:hypothetical protein